MEPSTATAFWSYAHADNDATGGHVRVFATEVAGAYQILTGERLTMFVDRGAENGLQWGDEWKEKIDTTIAGTTFFIPIISPSYLLSKNCRDEFMDFWEKAKSSNLGELLLPILYAPVDLSEETTDEICQIVRKIQHEDWTELRLEENTSRAYKIALNKIGTRLQEIALSVEAKPEEVHELADDAGEDDDEPGIYDLFASSETALDELKPALDGIGEAFTKIGEIFETTASLDSTSSAAKRLTTLKVLSHGLSGPAADFETNAKTMESSLRQTGLALAAAVSFSRDRTLDEDELTQMQSLRDDFAAMSDSVSDLFTDEDMAIRETLSQMRRMSRDLKKPASTLERGFRSLESTGDMLKGWVKSLDDLLEEKADAD